MEKQIKVIYLDGSAGTVTPSVLDYLIERHEIVAFCRSEGWIRIGKDPIRKEKHKFEGPGRRAGDLWSSDLGLN
ncbi:MAG: hypothetical protein FD174_4207 [Geobacteraceae bacterium]|nr:MAG: hypothetical protein FD174_4207 [Geobacteraceae bacterium]